MYSKVRFLPALDNHLNGLSGALYFDGYESRGCCFCVEVPGFCPKIITPLFSASNTPLLFF